MRNQKVSVSISKFFGILALSLTAMSLYAGPSGPFALRTAGVVPVQFFGPRLSDIHLGEIKQQLSENFSKFCRESQRFRVLNDDLILEHWSSPEGRNYLLSEFEIDSYLSLNVVLEEDVIRMSFRILDEKLKPVIVESEAIPFKSLVAGHDWKSLRAVIYRGVNRLPIDASVLSVQGAFVSLSAGSLQGLKEGEEYEVSEATVAGVHPADGSWLKFTSKRRGLLKIVSTREVSAVGEILEESFPGAVEVGQGILISNLRSRAYFTELMAQKKVNEAETKTQVYGESEKLAMTDGSKSDVPVAPIIGAEKPYPKPVLNTAQKSANEATAVAEEDGDAPNTVDPEKSGESSPEETAEGDENGRSLSGTIKDVLSQQDDVSLLFANNMWTVSGAASSASKIPFWFFNTAKLRGAIELTADTGLEWNAGLSLGTAKKTFYSGLGAGLAWVRTEKMQVFRPGDRLCLGIRGSFDTMAVRKESFGGFNLTRIGGLAGMNGKLKVGSTSLMQRHDFILDIIGSGQIGVLGKKKAVRTLFGYTIESEVYQDTAGDTAEEWKWGGLFRFSSSKISAKGGTLNLTEKVFGVTVRRFL